MTRSAEEIEREVEQTRAGLDQTVEALKSKMSPGQLIDELTQSLKGSGAGDMFGNLGHQVKDNPLALAMIGAGVAWLMMGKGHDGAHGLRSDSSGSADQAGVLGSGMAGAAESKTGDIKDKAMNMAQAATSGVSDMASHLKDGVAASAQSAMHVAQSAGQGVSELGHRAQRTFMDTLEQEPLIIGALGVAVGAAIGASLPATGIEDRTFGAARDRVTDKAKTMASDGVEQAKDAVEAAFVGARDAAEETGLIGAENGSLADKAEIVIRAGVEAAKNSAVNKH
jgi:hypothetical protein